MPTKWQGTIEERLERLDKSGRRCDANSRHCTRAAVNEYDLLPADGFGNPTGAEKVTKKCCSYHPKQFIDSGFWVVVEKRRLAQKRPSKPRPYDLDKS